MSDYISRQEAIDYCYALINAENPSDPRDEWNYSQERISQTEVILHHLEFMPSAQPEIVMCKDCRWGRKVCGNVECFADTNVPPEYHGYEWFCPNGERRTDE